MQNPQHHEFMPQTLLRGMTEAAHSFVRIDYNAHACFTQENGQPYVWFSMEYMYMHALHKYM